MKDQPVPVKNETSASYKSSQDTATVVHPVKPAQLPGPYGFTEPGYENARGEWDEYSPYIAAEGLDITSPGGFNENPSIVFHAGYGYNPQIPYGPYSPAASPLPSVAGDGQLYSAQQFPYSGHSPYYQQVVPPSMQYITSPTPVSQPELTGIVGVDQQGDNMLVGTRPTYHPHPIGPFNGSGFHGNQGSLGFPEWQQGFDGGIWSDWSKPSDMHRPVAPISPAVSPQPVGPFGSFGQNIHMGSQRQRSFYGFESGSNSYNRGYIHRGGHGQGSNYGSTLVSNVGMGNQGWVGVDNTRGRGRVTGSTFCGGCNVSLDILNEQNRGPRASKPKAQIMEELDSSADAKKNNKASAKQQDETYNNTDFVMDYNDAKFFIIKSYSEDNVHKSIKYNVWASTPNGNKKLDAAHREAKEKQEPCPVFLLFSVNASAQFCGVAEMIGPVDFEKSVDYWQQDKWSGQFPVKWHIIKDVPNSLFRHIILENNDNKPVTNSRDTQEVKLEQGIEMLKIFNSYEADTSILDDFDFYEEREKMIQERKARRQQESLTSAGIAGENDHKPTTGALAVDFIKTMSKSFAQVVRVDEGEEAEKEAGRASSSPEAVTTAAVPSGESN
ncbi:PREDICTED: uncharacterized protein LOC104815708 isoform X2 [Tarenaya hassleriana]|nr:PREDICTED: uncharacterized protein LOC104815708 isoform X2 [Tarenaya hassleriana]